MDSSRLNDWLQVVGLFGVIASLLFVGLQMMQDRQIALAATFQERTIAVTDTIAAWTADKGSMKIEVQRLYGANPEDLVPQELMGFGESMDPITYEELNSAIYFAVIWWFHWENSHFQYQQGYLPQSHWDRIRATIKSTMSSQTPVRFMYDSDPDFLTTEFRDEVDRIKLELETGSGND